MGAQDVLYAWRDFECSFFAGALLCPRAPFRRFLVREAHRLASCLKLGVTSAVVMRRMTAVSPYRYWHYFDAYPPGFLRAVYRGNGILLLGNMSLVSDPSRAGPCSGAPWRTAPRAAAPADIADFSDARRQACAPVLLPLVLTRDAARTLHVQSVGVDLPPALEAQGYDGDGIVASVSEARRRAVAVMRPFQPGRRRAARGPGTEYPPDCRRAGIARRRHLPPERRVPARPRLRQRPGLISGAAATTLTR
jgi:hypothetical protein